MGTAASKLNHASFPTELILEVIKQLPFSKGETLDTLSQVSPRIKNIITNYERSITDYYVRTELRHAPTDFACPEDERRYAWLSECVARYDAVDDIMDLSSCQAGYTLLRCIMAAVNTGLLLLYRLQAFEPHSEKLEFIRSLPRDPLMAIYLACYYTTLAARYHGNGVFLQAAFGPYLDGTAVLLRLDVEFCFSEGSMQHGPSFIHSTFFGSLDVDSAIMMNLFLDHQSSDWYPTNWIAGTGSITPPIVQGPRRDPASMERSLTSVLLERLAELTDCPLEEIRGRIRDDVSESRCRLAWLSLSGKARLMKGEDLDD